MLAEVDASIRSFIGKITRRQMAVVAGSGAALLATGAAAVIIRKRKGIQTAQENGHLATLRDSWVGILEGEQVEKSTLTWGFAHPVDHLAVIEVGFKSFEVKGYKYAQRLTATRDGQTYILDVLDTNAAWQKRIIKNAGEIAVDQGWSVQVEKVRIVPVVVPVTA